MIELFDEERLRVRRDHSLAWAALALAVAVGATGLHGLVLHTRLRDQQALNGQLERRLQALAPARPTAAPPGARLLDDLRREAERLEAEAAAMQAHAVHSGVSPSAWLQRLALLAHPDISLGRIEVDQGGAVRIDGVARSPAAVSSFLQAWDRQQRSVEPAATGDRPVLARTLEIKEDTSHAPSLGFQLRATARAGRDRP